MSPHLPSVGTRPTALDTRALVTMPPHLPGQLGENAAGGCLPVRSPNGLHCMCLARLLLTRVLTHLCYRQARDGQFLRFDADDSLVHNESPRNVAAARVPDPRVAGLPEPSAAKEERHAKKASQQAPVVHGDVSVAIAESSDLIAAALEDMRSQGSKAKILLPSLLCSAVSSGA